jgi:hypothetical protein
MPTRVSPKQVLLDVHCATADGVSLCGGNKVPRISHDQFVQLGAVLTVTRHRPAWQLCPACVAIAERGSRDR